MAEIKRFKLGEHEYEMPRLKMGAIRQITELLDRSMTEFKAIDTNSSFTSLGDTILSKGHEILRILFPGPNFDFLTEEFYSKEILFVDYRAMLEESIVINNLQDIFPVLKNIVLKGTKQSSGQN